MNKTVFKERLRTLMKEQGYDAKSLAKASGVSRNSIYDYLKEAHEPSTSNLEKLGDCLGVHAMYLVGASDKKN